MILSPSLLSADFAQLSKELESLEEAGLAWVHWDVMDGNFVPNITFGQHIISQFRKNSKLFFDVHLMIEKPERYLEDFAKAGANMLVVHAESTLHLQRCLAEIRKLGMQAGIALNPATPLNVLDYILDDVDMVLLMSVNPGFGGQSFIPSTLEKLKKVKEMIGDREILIQIDGGVSPENAGLLCECGADVLVSGSAFFKIENYKKAQELFYAAIQEYKGK